MHIGTYSYRHICTYVFYICIYVLIHISGIASRSSSMTSLDSGDNKYTVSNSKSNTWKSSSTSKKANGSCPVDTVDGATQTSPTPGSR